MEKSKSNNYLKYLIYIFLIILIIYYGGKLNFLTSSLSKILTMTMTPMLLGLFLYYLFRPIVNYLKLKLNNKVLAIISTILIVLFLISILVYFGGNVITTQLKDLIADLNEFYNQQWDEINKNIKEGEGFYQLFNSFNLQNKLTNLIENIFNSIRSNIISFFSILTNYGTIILLIPFVLFYFLKDDKIIYKNMIKNMPVKNKRKFKKIILEIDETLSTYISGRLVISIILGILTYIGFLIIQLPNALILSLIIFVTSFIPIIGPLFGSLPAIFIAITTNIWLAIKVLIIIIILQIFEGNVIQPKIQGNYLEMHPLTVIFSVIIFTILYGIIGALFAVPFYVILRILTKHLFYEQESTQ